MILPEMFNEIIVRNILKKAGKGGRIVSKHAIIHCPFEMPGSPQILVG